MAGAPPSSAAATATTPPATEGDGAPASAPTLLFIAFSSTPVPFVGGTLLAFPGPMIVALSTDGVGSCALPFTWPVGVPAASAFYFQCAILDLAAIQSVSLSNGLRGVTP